MSKKRSVNDDGENLIKNIGERLKKQHEKTSKSKKNIQEETEKQNTDNKEPEDKEEKKQENTDIDNNWNKQGTYKTTYTVKPKMEDNYDRCRIKFRRELRTLLSKQDAIELGFLLLRKIDDDLFEEVRKNFSPEDDSIEALKTIIEEYY